MLKKFSIIFLALLLSVNLSGCRKQDTSESSEESVSSIESVAAEGTDTDDMSENSAFSDIKCGDLLKDIRESNTVIFNNYFIELFRNGNRYMLVCSENGVAVSGYAVWEDDRTIVSNENLNLIENEGYKDFLSVDIDSFCEAYSDSIIDIGSGAYVWVLITNDGYMIKPLLNDGIIVDFNVVDLLRDNNEESDGEATAADNIYAIDDDLQLALESCESNYETSSTYYEYAQKWFTYSEYCVEQIKNTEFIRFDEEIDEAIVNIHENWKVYIESRLEDQLALLQGYYQGGTIVPVLMAEYQYNEYRDHALEMYSFCQEMNIECKSPLMLEYSDEPSTSPQELIEDYGLCKLVKNEGVYYCHFYNHNGEVISTQGPFGKLPKILSVNEDIIRFTLQAGTGLGTQWGFFYDMKNEAMSDNFDCIFDQTDSLTALYDGGAVVVRSIFGDDYYMEIKDFQNPFSEVAIPIKDAVFSQDGKSVTVTYYTGDDFREVEETFELTN